MPNDFSRFLWLLKLGALVNIALLVGTLALPTPDPHAVIPAQILLVVSAYRCLFPNRYLHNIVFHDTPLSSIFLTRLLATVSEVAYIYQLSHVIRVLNTGRVGWVDGLSWLMVAQVVISQGFVWNAIGTRRLGLYFYEELGWLIIFAANTIASAFLYGLYALGETVGALGDARILILLNLLFGAVYLPWQIFHLRSLRAEATPGRVRWKKGLGDAIRQRNRRTDADSWGGLIGLTWMAAYWALLIPVWVYCIAVVLSAL